MEHKVKYAPPAIDVFGGIVFLLLSVVMIALSISLDLMSSKMEKQDIAFVAVIIFSGLLGLVKLYKSFTQPRNKEIILKPNTVLIPHQDDINSDEVILAKITCIEKSYDGFFLKLITEEQEYKIDLSWVKDKMAFDSLISTIKSTNPLLS